MDTLYNEWIGQNVMQPPASSESFTLDFKSNAEILSQPEAKILLNNRWGIKLYPLRELATPPPQYIPLAFDVVTGRGIETSANPLSSQPGPLALLGGGSMDVTLTNGRYNSFSLNFIPIPSRFEVEEMCNLWDRDVTVSFDLHVGGSLLGPFVQQGDRGTIRSLNRGEQRIKFRSGPAPKMSEWIHVCASSTLLDRNNSFAVQDFRIIIRIDENRKRPEVSLNVHQTDAIRREAFGARLLDPKHGDVVIRFPETVQALDREEKCLFAASEILCAFSPYFKNLLLGDYKEGAFQSVQYSVAYQGDVNFSALRSQSSGHRKVITVTAARFTDYHNILYYMYTGSLNLRYPLNLPEGQTRPLSSAGNIYNWDSFPRAANANEIYRLAGMMGLPELQTRAYHYLMATCSVDNVFDRLFDPYCQAEGHAPVRAVYQQFLARNWENVRSSGQWSGLLKRYRRTQREDEAQYLLDAICEILNAVTWDHKFDGLLLKNS